MTTNIEIEQTLDTLSQLCCAALAGDHRALFQRRDALLKTLLECGYARYREQSLQVELENRVRVKWSEPILVHRKELEAIAAKLEQRFNELKRWETKLPQQTEPPDAA
ncbi:MAG: hypothetical protein ACF788_02705, partial [Novipirellula sp. JB048]